MSHPFTGCPCSRKFRLAIQIQSSPSAICPAPPRAWPRNREMPAGCAPLQTPVFPPAGQKQIPRPLRLPGFVPPAGHLQAAHKSGGPLDLPPRLRLIVPQPFARPAPPASSAGLPPLYCLPTLSRFSTRPPTRFLSCALSPARKTALPPVTMLRIGSENCSRHSFLPFCTP